MYDSLVMGSPVMKKESKKLLKEQKSLGNDFVLNEEENFHEDWPVILTSIHYDDLSEDAKKKYLDVVYWRVPLYDIPTEGDVDLDNLQPIYVPKK